MKITVRLLCLRLLLAVCNVSGADDLNKPANTTILMVDDHHILYRSGTVRKLKPLKRFSDKPIIAADKLWETTVAYCSVYKNPESGKYQLWYQAWPGRSGCYMCYAESDDGINWIKPELGLLTFNGSSKNNILFKNGYGASVIFDKNDPDPDKRYKSAFWEQDLIKGLKYPGMSIAYSPDGIHWEKHPKNPLIKGSYGDYIQPPLANDLKQQGAQGKPVSVSDVIDLIWDQNRQVYAVYAKTWLDGPKGDMHWKRAVVRTESKNFIDWTKPRLIIWPDEFDSINDLAETDRTAGGGGSDGVQLHSGPAFYYNDLYFSMLQVMDSGGTGNMAIELALSRDGYSWKRPFRNIWFIPPLENKKLFDASLIWSNATPVYSRDVFRFYYGAYGKPWNSSDNRQISGIGFAEMPRNRFAGIRPLKKFGQITLKSLALDKIKRIEVNGHAANGAISVEVLGDSGYRIKGFTKADSIPIKTDSLRNISEWNNESISQLPKGRYRLRIHLENAEVYAVTLIN